MNNVEIFETTLPEEAPSSKKHSFVKVSTSVSGVVSFENTYNKKEAVSLKRLHKIFA